jgi:uncharacterized membrane protein YgcG
MRTKKTIHKVTIIFIFFFIILSIFSLITSITSCTSKQNDISKTKDQSQAQDTSLTDANLPDYHNFVNDYTGTLSEEWIAKTEQFARSVEEATTCEIAVAVINSLEGLTIEDYALKLFEKWGIGKKEKDNGILLLVAMDDRELRIEVGYGLEGIITDIEAKEIIDEVIVPIFKDGDYNTGIYNGVVAIANKIYLEQGQGPVTYEESIETVVKKSFTETGAFPALIVFITMLPWIIIGTVFIVAFLKSYIKEHECPRCRRIGLIIKKTILVNPTYIFSGRASVVKLCRYCGFGEKSTVTIPRLVKQTYSSSSSSGFSSSSSSSSHSSSSSFGGGSSGGGGASGSW